MDAIEIQIGEVYKRSADIMQRRKIHERSLQEGRQARAKSSPIEYSLRAI